MENHINAKHQPKKCPLCEETFTTKQDLVSHLNSCMDTNEIEHQLYECDKCHKKINRGDIRSHKKNGACNSEQRQIVCNKCRAICISKDDLKKHIADDHYKDTSKEVCKHWKAGNCFKGARCNYAHVGYQDKEVTSRASTTPCRNGSSCAWLARGKCNFRHQEERHQEAGQRRQEARQSQQSQSGASNQMCWNRENCRRSFCRFKHLSRQDFPEIRNNQSQSPQVWSGSRQ